MSVDLQQSVGATGPYALKAPAAVSRLKDLDVLKIQRKHRGSIRDTMIACYKIVLYVYIDNECAPDGF